MTAVSTILSIIMLPLNLLIYAKYSYDDDVINSLDWASLFLSLMVVISAIASGLLISRSTHSHKFNKVANQVRLSVSFVYLVVNLYKSQKILPTFVRSNSLPFVQIGNAAGVSLVAFSAFMTNTGSGDSQLWARPYKFYLGVATPCILGLVLSTFVTSALQLNKPERV